MHDCTFRRPLCRRERRVVFAHIVAGDNICRWTTICAVRVGTHCRRRQYIQNDNMYRHIPLHRMKEAFKLFDQQLQLNSSFFHSMCTWMQMLNEFSENICIHSSLFHINTTPAYLCKPLLIWVHINHFFHQLWLPIQVYYQFI